MPFLQNRKKILDNLQIMVDRRKELIDVGIGDWQEYKTLDGAIKLIEELIYLNQGYTEDITDLLKKLESMYNRIQETEAEIEIRIMDSYRRAEEEGDKE